MAMLIKTILIVTPLVIVGYPIFMFIANKYIPKA